MNQPKSRPGIGQLITLHSGKVSFFITLLLLLFFDAIKLITFDSIMPYLAGICIWAFLWQQCTRPTPPHIPVRAIHCAYCSCIIRHYCMP